MRHVIYTAKETCLRLRRDKIFVPALISSVMTAMFANIASEWSVQDYKTVLFDIEFFGFNLTGSLVALFWGHRLISDSRQEGALEVQLAAPISRSSWLWGKYFGLITSLIGLGMLMIGIWQIFLWGSGFGVLTRPDFLVFVFSMLGWCVLAAAALFFATFMGPQVALFSTICLWLAGLSATLVVTTLDPQTAGLNRQVVELLGRYWDLQQFNLSRWANVDAALTAEALAWRAAYGACLILGLLTAGTVIFERRDLAG